MHGFITSILDSDLYKFTQQFAVLRKFPNLKVKYTFKDRNNQIYPQGFADLIQMQLNMFPDIKLTQNEAEYLHTIPFLQNWYVDFLKGYRFNPNEVKVSQDKKGHLLIEIEGFWYSVILWEVPLLAIISDLFYKETFQATRNTHDCATSDLIKLRLMESHNAFFSDFGTRRRFDRENQERVVKLFKEKGNHCFVGTSNVFLAYKYGLKATGTMAHEWIMVHAAMFGYRLANKTALDNWSDVYEGNLGIALSDTFTTDVFLQTFDMKLSKLFDGVRQDSGNPYKFVDKVIAHYKKLGIDPMTKTIIFSDSLTVEKAVTIKEYCVGKIKSSFGIGTHLTNDVGVKPMNIVIKLSAIEINGGWIDCIKLSDDIRKNMGNIEEIEICKKILKMQKNDDEKIQTIVGFSEKVLSNTIDIDNENVNIVNEKFWDLI